MRFKLENAKGLKESMFCESEFGAFGFCVSSGWSLENSIEYSLQTKKYVPLPMGRGAWHVSGNSFFLVAETGIAGFDTEIEVRFCEVENREDETVLRFRDASPEEFEKAEAAFRLSAESKGDLFESCALGEVMRLDGSKIGGYIKALGETKFIRMDGTGFIKCGMLEDGRLDSNVYVVNEGGEIEVRKPEVGDLLLEEKNGWGRISKVQEIAHDFNARLWALCKVVNLYPRDADAISVKCPRLYKRFNEELSEAKKSKEKELSGRSYAPRASAGKLGDMVIMQKVIEDYRQLAIRAGTFQFSVADADYGVYGDMRRLDDRALRIVDGMAACVCVEVSGQCNLIIYKYDGIVESDDGYYASFRYKEESGFFTPGNGELGGKFEKAEKILYTCMYMGLFLPVKVSREEYSAWPVNL
jgi:hypothetical protein